MKVLVLNPPYVKYYCRTERWAARTRGRTLRPPDWLAYATAVLEKEGHETKLVDGPALDLSKRQIKEIVESFKPDVAILDCCTPSVYSDIEYAKLCKEIAGCTTVFVGPHVSALPDETARLARGAVDYFIVGEYDYTVRDLVESIEKGAPKNSIDGILYWQGNELRRNKPRQLIEDLDKLPFPAWHHINIWKYYDGTKLYPYITCIAGRGCPHRCTFCLWPQVMHGRRYRLRSPENVIDEMEYDLKLFPMLKEIMFEDDTLTADRKRLNRLCDGILERGLNITWSANARADFCDVNLLKKMKKAGCRMLVVGFESGNDRILKNINKGITTAIAKKFASACKEAGIKVHGCFMIGLPGETRNMALQTIKFAKELDLDTIQISAAVPFPGTEFFKYCQDRGFLKLRDWTEYLDSRGEQATFVSYPELNSVEINMLVDRGLKEFYFKDPRKWLGLVLETKSFSDFKRKFYGFKSLIEYFLKRY